MDIRFNWDDPITNEPQEIIATLPVAIGRVINSLPTEHQNQAVHPLEFNHSTISAKHLIIYSDRQKIIIEDLNSTNGTTLNGKKFKNTKKELHSGDNLKLASYYITIVLLRSNDRFVTQLASRSSFSSTYLVSASELKQFSQSQLSQSQLSPNQLNDDPLYTPSSTIRFNFNSDQVESQPIVLPTRDEFPFNYDGWNQQFVSIDDLNATGLKVETTTYATLGGGMGSFVYADTLRIYGVDANKIVAIGLKTIPYERYQNLLENCQIKTLYRKRIRSGSDSCPDNIWGFPGYAIRDAWRAFFNGEAGRSLYHLWQVFSEPVGADTYTPRAEDVFASMDAEMERIQWSEMIRTGVIKSIRKTEDGRYAIAYTATQIERQEQEIVRQENKFLLARYVHLCTGYPALKLLPELQVYRDKYNEITQNHKRVVHGYEPHDYLYENLEKKGGVVVIRGFGIVASQILDRLYIAKKAAKRIKKDLKICHIGRTRKTGNEFPPARRFVEHNWEFQPYNWPKACWGGDMRSQLEAADPFKRRELLDAWGDTTTASRSEWRKYIREGLMEKWYQQKFGTFENLEQDEAGKLVITLRQENKVEEESQVIEKDKVIEIKADYVIDCTGLISDLQESPLLKDLIEHYHLDLNIQRRFHVENDFEIKKMANKKGRMYASGIITLGGPYAGVDTFLGLQYSAHRIAESLVKLKAPKMQGLNPIRSFFQWIKWIIRQTP